MQLSIRYLMGYSYETEVSDSHNALRACPAATDTQKLIRYDVTVDPAARVSSHVDYWGTQVETFGITRPHTRLTVVADSVVETSAPAPPEESAPWTPDDAIRLYEYLMPSAHVAWNEEVSAAARSVIGEGSGALERAEAIQRAVGEHLTYTPGATEIGTSVQEVFEGRVGVCQDYTHLALAMYRSSGIPARYVSGYLYAANHERGTEPAEAEIHVLTHAWVEVAMPRGGWHAVDPTNQRAVGERHVKIGHGRDYEDVTPLRGVYHGAPVEGTLDVSVTMSIDSLASPVVPPQPRVAPYGAQQQ